MKSGWRLLVVGAFTAITAGLAAENGDTDQELKAALMPRNRSLHEAAQRGDIEDMTRILALGVDVNAPDGDGIKIRRWSAITANLAA